MEISIIIPIYNTEKYLHTCIESVLNQEYREFELILVNDGSTDASGAICDTYAKQDSRVKVFHKENGGVSSARNLGLEKAQGRFISFVDSDDYIGSDYLKIFVESEKADMIISIEERDIERWGFGVFSSKDITYDHLTFFFGNYFGMICRKFYKKEIIENNSLRFDETIRFMEDAIFNLNYAMNCEKYSIIGQLPYHYEYRPDSMSHIFDIDYARNIYIKYNVQCQFVNRFIHEDNKNVFVELKLYNFMLAYSYNLYHLESRCLFNTIKDLFFVYIDDDVKALIEADDIRMFGFEVMQHLYRKNKMLIKQGMFRTLYSKSIYLRFVLWNKLLVKNFLRGILGERIV